MSLCFITLKFLALALQTGPVKMIESVSRSAVGHLAVSVVRCRLTNVAADAVLELTRYCANCRLHRALGSAVLLPRSRT